MIRRESFSLKKVMLWLGVASFGIITAYVVLIGVVSISQGIHNVEKDGFWVPVLVGSLCILIMMFFVYRLVQFFYHYRKRSERLQM
jgi:sterol desaturase/sphingolipid hydroxylase (fatty acid hydroxylase superfamily)